MGHNHVMKVKEAEKEKEELYNSGIKAGDHINCNGTTSQKFWRRHYLLLRYFCCHCNESFETADAKKEHMGTKHGNDAVCSACCQLASKGGSAHVITVPQSFEYHVGGAEADESNN